MKASHDFKIAPAHKRNNENRCISGICAVQEGSVVYSVCVYFENDDAVVIDHAHCMLHVNSCCRIRCILERSSSAIKSLAGYQHDTVNLWRDFCQTKSSKVIGATKIIESQ